MKFVFMYFCNDFPCLALCAVGSQKKQRLNTTSSFLSQVHSVGDCPEDRQHHTGSRSAVLLLLAVRFVAKAGSPSALGRGFHDFETHTFRLTVWGCAKEL